MAARRGFAGVCRTYLAQGSFLLAKNELGEQPADVARGPAALLLSQMTGRAPPEADRRASEDEPDTPENEPDTQDDEPGDCSAFLRGRHHLPEDDDEVHTGWVSRNPVDVHAWWDA